MISSEILNSGSIKEIAKAVIPKITENTTVEEYYEIEKLIEHTERKEIEAIKEHIDNATAVDLDEYNKEKGEMIWASYRSPKPVKHPPLDPRVLCPYIREELGGRNITLQQYIRLKNENNKKGV